MKLALTQRDVKELKPPSPSDKSIVVGPIHGPNLLP